MFRKSLHVNGSPERKREYITFGYAVVAEKYLKSTKILKRTHTASTDRENSVVRFHILSTIYQGKFIVALFDSVKKELLP